MADAIDDPNARRVVVGLLRRAADQAALIGEYAQVNTLLSGALRLIDPNETLTLMEVHIGEGTDTLQVQVRDNGRGGATLTGAAYQHGQ